MTASQDLWDLLGRQVLKDRLVRQEEMDNQALLASREIKVSLASTDQLDLLDSQALADSQEHLASLELQGLQAFQDLRAPKAFLAQLGQQACLAFQAPTGFQARMETLALQDSLDLLAFLEGLVWQEMRETVAVQAGQAIQVH